jgi:hypothetical protein
VSKWFRTACCVVRLKVCSGTASRLGEYEYQSTVHTDYRRYEHSNACMFKCAIMDSVRESTVVTVASLLVDG